jgi:hypothetical protein
MEFVVSVISIWKCFLTLVAAQRGPDRQPDLIDTGKGAALDPLGDQIKSRLEPRSPKPGERSSTPSKTESPRPQSRPEKTTPP